MKTTIRLASGLGLIVVIALLALNQFLFPRDVEAAHSCNGGNGVYLYEDRNYGGRCIRLTEGVDNLAKEGFDDIISSIKLNGDWIATLYADPNYQGAMTVFTSDDPDLSDDEIRVNRASSVRVYRGRLPNENRCDGGEGVYLFEDINYRGYCIKLTGDQRDFNSFGFDNAVSSLRVIGAWSVTLYENTLFRGTSSTFTSDDPDLRDDAININRASSARVSSTVPSNNRCDGNEGAYLYSERNYAGRCVRMTSDNVDLRTVGFDDAAASIRIIGNWSATLYADLSFNGASSTFTSDDPDLSDDGIGYRRATSIRVGRPGAGLPAQYACDGQNGVYLYEHPNYAGRCVRLTNSMEDLRIVGFDDQASSLRVIGNWTVSLYRDLSYTGISSTYSADDPDLSNDGIGDNQATSILIHNQGGGTGDPGLACDGSEGVYLYEHPQFGGRCIRFVSDAPDLRVYGFDDQASSLHIVGNWTATLFRDLNGTGIATIFTESDTDLSDDSIGDNQATSLQVRRR